MRDRSQMQKKITALDKIFKKFYGSEEWKSYFKRLGYEYASWVYQDIDMQNIKSEQDFFQTITKMQSQIKKDIESFRKTLLTAHDGARVEPNEAYRLAMFTFDGDPFRTLSFLYAMSFWDVMQTDKMISRTHAGNRNRDSRLTPFLSLPLAGKDKAGQMYHFYGHASLTFSTDIRRMLSFFSTMSEMWYGDKEDTLADNAGRKWAEGLLDNLLASRPKECPKQKTVKKKNHRECLIIVSSDDNETDALSRINPKTDFENLDEDTAVTFHTTHFSESRAKCEVLAIHHLKAMFEQNEQSWFVTYRFENAKPRLIALDEDKKVQRTAEQILEEESAKDWQIYLEQSR